MRSTLMMLETSGTSLELPNIWLFRPPGFDDTCMSCHTNG
jgi:hypothetical protein